MVATPPQYQVAGMDSSTPEQVLSKPFKVLCLDGGGAKGVYTLGFLREFERASGGAPLSDFFDAIYGTSTGAIIAALLGLGNSAEVVLDLYLQYVPKILKPLFPSSKSKALAEVGKTLFGNRKFDDFQTFIGIVATNWTAERPLIFKSSVDAAHGLKGTFEPGFGRTISEAVQASCSASPFFDACVLDLGAAGVVQCRDGGFAANNPSLFAITDALKSFRRTPEQVRLLTLGVGHYPEPKYSSIRRFIQSLPAAHLLQKTLSVNANTTEQIVTFLCDKVPHLRISGRFESPDLATDFLECRLEKLNLLIQKGRDSFGKEEAKVRELFEDYGQS
jgi:patatin-like phospholipase/acyl hydrolase